MTQEDNSLKKRFSKNPTKFNKFQTLLETLLFHKINMEQRLKHLVVM